MLSLASIASKIFGSSNDRMLKTYRPKVEAINALEAEIEKLSDADLRARCETKALKLGRHLAVNRSHIHSILEVNKLAERLEKDIVT